MEPRSPRMACRQKPVPHKANGPPPGRVLRAPGPRVPPSPRGAPPLLGPVQALAARSLATDRARDQTSRPFGRPVRRPRPSLAFAPAYATANPFWRVLTAGRRTVPRPMERAGARDTRCPSRRSVLAARMRFCVRPSPGEYPRGDRKSPASRQEKALEAVGPRPRIVGRRVCPTFAVPAALGRGLYPLAQVKGSFAAQIARRPHRFGPLCGGHAKLVDSVDILCHHNPKRGQMHADRVHRLALLPDLAIRGPRVEQRRLCVGQPHWGQRLLCCPGLSGTLRKARFRPSDQTLILVVPMTHTRTRGLSPRQSRSGSPGSATKPQLRA